MKNKKRFVPWLIAAVIIAAFAVIGKKLYDLMFGGSLAVTTEDLKNGSQSSTSRSAVQQAIIDCSDYIKMVQKPRKIKVFRGFLIPKRADIV